MEDAQQASVLLDQLIVYLRLAMSREREKDFSMAGEIELVHAYLALIEAERGVRIALAANVQGDRTFRRGHPLPLFAVVRTLIDQAVANDSKALRLRLDALPPAATITLDAESRFEDVQLSQMRDQFARLPVNGPPLDILEDSFETGNYRYVVKVTSHSYAADGGTGRG